jgi:hypothetical protein
MAKNTTPKPTSEDDGDDFDKLLGSDGSNIDALDDGLAALDVDQGRGGIPNAPEGYDPLAGLEPKDDIGEDAKQEMDTFRAEFSKLAKSEVDGAILANDSEFWCALVFQTREQKEAFLKAMGWIKNGDKYIDGQWAAKKQGITLPEAPSQLAYYLRDLRVKKKFAELPAIERIDGQ